MRFSVRRIEAPAARLVDRPPAPGPTVTVCRSTDEAVVLGSTQRGTTERGVNGVRRRTGGGAVWVAPGAQVWIDIDLPRRDALWDDDVGRSSWWLGAVWASVVGEGAEVHHGGLVRSAWSEDICFAGLGPGEVTVAGRKVVGLSQRRTRDGARLSTAGLLAWDPAPLVAALGLPPEALVDVQDRATTLVGGIDDVEAQVLALLADL